MINMGIGILHKYKDHIDLDGASRISMGEGDTGLIYSEYLSNTKCVVSNYNFRKNIYKHLLNESS